MKKIIDGKLYDTNKMKCMFSTGWIIGEKFSFYHIRDDRYLEIWSPGLGSANFWKVVPEFSMKNTAEEYLSAEEYIKLFGPVEEA